jgi:type IV secretion system protein TrbI
MDDKQLEVERTVDIVGPGREEKILRPEALQTGRRLNKKAKHYALLGLGAVSSLILLGVAVSGHRSNSEATASDSGNAELIGQAAPPAPPPALTPLPSSRLAHIPVSRETTLDGPQDASKYAIEDHDALAAGSAAGPEPHTPAQKYQEWLKDQQYKNLEGNVLSAQAALLAPPGKSGTLLAEGASSPSPTLSVDSGSAWLSAALDAARTGVAVTETSVRTPADSRVQGENARFLEEERKALDKNGYLTQSLQNAAADHEVFAGSIIPAVLISSINSDLPGEINAQVRQNVFDSLSPNQVLIPQGARLIGEYSSEVAYGQRRVLVVWNRLIYPNGATLALQGMPGTDGIGQAGLGDQVDNHYGRVFGGALLISMLGVAGQLSQPQNTSVLTAPSAGQQATAAAATEMNNVGTQMLQKNLNIQPTLVIRPGELFNVLVTRTMILPPYPG